VVVVVGGTVVVVLVGETTELVEGGVSE